VADKDAPVFEFSGSWPFNGEVKIGGHPVGTATAWTVTADADGLPKVTLTLLAPTALALALAKADVTVDDRTADALKKLGWTPPSD
jgi:hypothetical protein